MVFVVTQSFSQKFKLELAGGIINYQGDLQPKLFTFNLAQPAAGIFLKYEIPGNIVLRTGFSTGRLYANDKFNRDYLQPRNLNFHSNISEIQLAVEYNLLNLQKYKFSPYLFFGLAVYHFNPYTFDNAGSKIFLQPLSTEGEGLSEFPGKKKYGLTQAAIPFGGGITYKINCNSSVSLEFSQRKLFTDYIDDVSTNYADQNILFSEKGPKAVELAYRGNELPGGAPYPANGSQRGNPKQNDWYYSTMLKFSFNLVSCESGKSIFSGLSGLTSLFGEKNSGNEKIKNNTKCPRNVL
ncbi:MAG: outer membrane beta-barrel protein [Chitinophagaceae bacterium]|nr:outer membrane beta-barrel protein [Chitinophagaceae bacterium]